MKNKVSIFAANKPSSILLISKVAAILFSANIGLSLPADCCTLQSVIGLGGSGGDSLFYNNTLIIHSQMPSLMNDASMENNSNRTSTSAGTKSVPYSKFLIEMNAKNSAYYFIISQGLFKKFENYCKNYHSDNPHADCLRHLELLVINKN